MRRKVLGGATLMGVVAALAVSGTASAGHPGGCTNSYTPVLAASVNDTATDRNDNGWICTKAISIGNSKGAFSDVDDNAQGSNPANPPLP